LLARLRPPLLARSVFYGQPSTLSFFWTSSIDYRDAPAQEQERVPGWAGNEKKE